MPTARLVGVRVPESADGSRRTGGLHRGHLRLQAFAVPATARSCPCTAASSGVVQRIVVLADIRQQVAAGAQHITFGDPDFFNGPAHATLIVAALLPMSSSG